MEAVTTIDSHPTNAMTRKVTAATWAGVGGTVASVLLDQLVLTGVVAAPWNAIITALIPVVAAIGTAYKTRPGKDEGVKLVPS